MNGKTCGFFVQMRFTFFGKPGRRPVFGNSGGKARICLPVWKPIWNSDHNLSRKNKTFLTLSAVFFSCRNIQIYFKGNIKKLENREIFFEDPKMFFEGRSKLKTMLEVILRNIRFSKIAYRRNKIYLKMYFKDFRETKYIQNRILLNHYKYIIYGRRDFSSRYYIFLKILM